MDEQSIRFVQVDGRRVAWAAVGVGPPLVIGGWWMCHHELNWRDPAFRGFVQAVGRHRPVVRSHSPGIGLSDRVGPPPASVDQQVDVLAAVIEAHGEGPVDLWAASSGGPVATAYAAANPAGVGRLVHYGSYARGAEIATAADRAAILAVIRDHWGLGSRVLADMFLPTASAEERRSFVEFQREAASAELAAATLEAVYAYDIGDRLDRVAVPVQVLHRREDRAIPFRLGQELAAAIPGASFHPLEGADHFPWRGRSREALRAALRGLGVAEEEIELEPEAATDAAPDGADPEAIAEAGLSKRELEVLRLVALGLSDREIADRLVLSPHTVHRHVANIRTKLRLPSRAAAAAQAARLGLI
jgi:DNA-binding NarL/FixJ family response regulator